MLVVVFVTRAPRTAPAYGLLGSVPILPATLGTDVRSLDQVRSELRRAPPVLQVVVGILVRACAPAHEVAHAHTRLLGIGTVSARGTKVVPGHHVVDRGLGAVAGASEDCEPDRRARAPGQVRKGHRRPIHIREHSIGVELGRRSDQGRALLVQHHPTLIHDDVVLKQSVSRVKQTYRRESIAMPIFGVDGLDACVKHVRGDVEVGARIHIQALSAHTVHSILSNDAADGVSSAIYAAAGLSWDIPPTVVAAIAHHARMQLPIPSKCDSIASDVFDHAVREDVSRRLLQAMLEDQAIVARVDMHAGEDVPGRCCTVDVHSCANAEVRGLDVLNDRAAAHHAKDGRATILLKAAEVLGTIQRKRTQGGCVPNAHHKACHGSWSRNAEPRIPSRAIRVNRDANQAAVVRHRDAPVQLKCTFCQDRSPIARVEASQNGEVVLPCRGLRPERIASHVDVTFVPRDRIRWRARKRQATRLRNRANI
mmetsp:Transcript_107574/g.273055  ORF Transcript_107574/g.273055 Transcript_107574/m.273055 type:complete len:481 (+) Transcript_107574:167-1609(+)